MSRIENNILDAIDIIMNQKVSTLAFDRTVRASILELVDSSIGKYRVKYQNSTFFAYSGDLNKSFKKGTEVYVLVHSGDFEKDASIVGAVAKLGTDYLSAVTPEDRFTAIGNNIFKLKKEISFCSYAQTSQIVDIQVDVDANGFNLYKDQTNNFLLAASFQTALPQEQRVGGGDYGLILSCKYYNDAYKNHDAARQASDGFIIRDYVLNIDNMTGQPYQYDTPNRQYAIFKIDGKNLESLVGFRAFCKGFPHINPNKNTPDIFIKDVELLFVKPLTEKELQGPSLDIVTPQGSYFSDWTQQKRIVATLKIKGNKVNYNQQKVDFYWFIKDSSVTPDKNEYSSWGGAGWRCLNKFSESNGTRIYQPETYYKDITAYECPSKDTTFKCVAIFQNENIKTSISAEITLRNDLVFTQYKITSSMGARFAFNLGKTTLSVEPFNNGDICYWARSINGESFTALPEHGRNIEVDVSKFLDSAKYEVTVYNNGQYKGAAAINLTNGVAAGQYTLVLNNASQVFKYNAQGIAPTSIAIDEDKRIKNPPVLSFDIYNDMGQKITLSDEQKRRMCNIKWIWPGNADSSNTMLVSYYRMKNDYINNPNSNTTTHRYVLENDPNFVYYLLNRYDATRTANNILLEVDYKGQHLTATTKFTFTKEGELGTNGTKYIARLVPRDSNIDHIFVWNNEVKGYKFNSDGSIKILHPTVAALKGQIWDGGTSPIYDNALGPHLDGRVVLKWEVTNSGRRNSPHKIEIGGNGEIIVNHVQIDCSSTVQVGISTNTLNQDVKTYYAGYPIDVSYSMNSNIPLVLGGYNHCMYESDGTRSTFNPQPFVFKLFDVNGIELNIDPNRIGWYDTWTKKIRSGSREIIIEPPDKYDGTELNHYIKAWYENYTVIVSVDFYLNRYGLAAVNAWDGNSIKINNEGSKYILAPQIGAGKKEFDNSFTGVTMGKTMDNSKQKADIGLFGYHQGEQSFFLDADTGDAYFGISGKNQIQIKPSDGTANIQSGNYRLDPNDHNGSGMLIDFSTPRIQFGSDRFRVDANGCIHAAGNGDIAGWYLNDDELYSRNHVIHLLSSGDGTIYSNHHTSLDKRNHGFYLSSNGLSIGSTIEITADEGGAIKVGRLSGSRHWIINGDANESYIAYNAGGFEAWNLGDSNSYSINGNSGSVFLGTDGLRLGRRFAVDREGNLVAKNLIAKEGGNIGGWSISQDELYAEHIHISSRGSIHVDRGGNDSWSIESDGSATFNNLTANGKGEIAGWNIEEDELYGQGIHIRSNGSIDASYSGSSGWKITAEGDAYFYSGKIGGWDINSNSLSSGNMYISQGGSMNGPGWSISANGDARFDVITANNVFSFGSGANTWTNNGFNFDSGSLGGNTVAPHYFTHSAGSVNLGGTTMNEAGTGLTEGATKVNGKGIRTYVEELSVGVLHANKAFIEEIVAKKIDTIELSASKIFLKDPFTGSKNDVGAVMQSMFLIQRNQGISINHLESQISSLEDRVDAIENKI